MVRFDREICLARSRYVAAADRLTEAMGRWQAAAVPLGETGRDVPAWTSSQVELTARTARAWSELVACRREWEALLREIGYQR